MPATQRLTWCLQTAGCAHDSGRHINVPCSGHSHHPPCSNMLRDAEYTVLCSTTKPVPGLLPDAAAFVDAVQYSDACCRHSRAQPSSGRRRMHLQEQEPHSCPSGSSCPLWVVLAAPRQHPGPKLPAAQLQLQPPSSARLLPAAGGTPSLATWTLEHAAAVGNSRGMQLRVCSRLSVEGEPAVAMSCSVASRCAGGLPQHQPACQTRRT